MSDWINEEAEKFQLLKDQKQQKDYWIAFANYWADLTEQIRNDVQTFNTNPVWKAILQDKPLRIVKDVEGFKIEKLSFPAVYITLDNIGSAIEMNVEIAKTADKATKYKESLEAIANNKRIYLVRNTEAFLIPEQASKYILEPILKALKGEVAV